MPVLRGAIKATKYLNKDLVVKAKRKMYDGKIDKRSKIAEVYLTIGAPNYQERKEIKKFGDSFMRLVVKYPEKGGGNNAVPRG
jgi:hypothetical protein